MDSASRAAQGEPGGRARERRARLGGRNAHRAPGVRPAPALPRDGPGDPSRREGLRGGHRARAFARRRRAADRRSSRAPRSSSRTASRCTPGQKLVQPALARTLKAIAARGKRGFYEGEVAKAIVDEQKRDGGVITLDDLKGYHPAWREPLTGTYRGWTIISMPPSISGGITMIETLNILETFAPLPPARSAGADAPARRGPPPRLRRPQRALGRSRLRAAPRAAPHEQAVRPRPGRDDPAELRDPHRGGRTPVAERRAPSAERRAPSPSTPRTTRWSTPKATPSPRPPRSTISTAPASTSPPRGFFLNDEMDDFTTNPGAAERLRPRAGRAQRRRAREAHAERDGADDRPRFRGPRGARARRRAAARGSSPRVTQVLLGVMEYGQSLPDAVVRAADPRAGAPRHPQVRRRRARSGGASARSS